MRGRRTRLAAALLVLAAAASFILGTAGPASAHATLVSTDPIEGAVLPAAPKQIRLTFDESVVTARDGTQVFDATGGAIAAASAATDTELVVTLEEEVSPGTLVIVWRVVSADGHPISGSLSFSVGAPSENVLRPAGVSTEVPRAPLLLSLSRWVGYTGLLLSAGLVAFVVLFLPRSAAADRARVRLLRVLRVAAVITALTWAAALPMVAAYQLGGGAASLVRASTWATVALAEYGVSVVVVAGVLLAASLLGPNQVVRSRDLAAGVAAVLAVCAPAFTGHTRGSSSEVVAVAIDVAHLLAGSVWLGGLVALALVLPDLAGRGTLGAEVLARFSGAAAGLLAALVVAGSLLAWRIVGSWDALVGTGYGQLLVVKVLAAAAAIAIATWNRYRLLPVLRRASRRDDRRTGADRLSRATAAEAAVVVVVLLVTGLLVDRSPQAEASVTERAGSARVVGPLGDHEVAATLSPLTPGRNTLVVEMTNAAGQPLEGLDVPTLRLASDQVDLGEVVATNIGPGTYTTEAVLPNIGSWRLEVSLRVGEFENPVAVLEFTVTAPDGVT